MKARLFSLVASCLMSLSLLSGCLTKTTSL